MRSGRRRWAWSTSCLTLTLVRSAGDFQYLCLEGPKGAGESRLGGAARGRAAFANDHSPVGAAAAHARGAGNATPHAAAAAAAGTGKALVRGLEGETALAAIEPAAAAAAAGDRMLGCDGCAVRFAARAFAGGTRPDFHTLVLAADAADAGGGN